MKKLGSIAIIAIFAALALSSCKKDYSCSCTWHDTSGFITDSTWSFTIHDKKSGAESSCTNVGTSLTAGTLTTTCTIK